VTEVGGTFQDGKLSLDTILWNEQFLSFRSSKGSF